MRVFTVSLSFLLVLAACAPVATPQENPTSVPIEATRAPIESSPASPEPAVKATLESSLLASEWRGNSEGNVLFPMDPATGTALPEYAPIPLGHTFFPAFFPDRRALAVVSFPNENVFNGSLLLVDLPAWKTQTFELGLIGWVSTMAFSPDGRKLAIAHGQSSQQLTLVDLEKGEIAAQRETGSGLVSRLKFTKNGAALMFYGPVVKNRFTENEMSAGPPQILLFDAADLNLLWSVEVSEIRDGIFPRDENVTPANIHEPGQAFYLNPGLAFAPNRDALYILHADSEKLTTVDFEQQNVETVEIQTKLTWFEKLLSLTAGVVHAKIGDGINRQAAVSQDGQFLYVVGMNSVIIKDKQGNWQMEQTPHGLEIIRTSDGTRLEYFESDATELSLSPDGRFLYLRGWEKDTPWTQMFDTASQEFGIRKNGVFAEPVLRLNGEYLVASTFSTGEFTHHMSILEPERLNGLAAWIDSKYVWFLTP